MNDIEASPQQLTPRQYSTAFGEFIGIGPNGNLWVDGCDVKDLAERFVEQSRQVIEVDGERVGVLEIDDRPDELYLALLELSPSWQGKGLGTDVLRSVIAQAKRSNKPLAQHVLRTNPRARAFYKREGLYVARVEPTKLLMRTR